MSMADYTLEELQAEWDRRQAALANEAEALLADARSSDDPQPLLLEGILCALLGLDMQLKTLTRQIKLGRP